jgi:hypothetical protein
MKTKTKIIIGGVVVVIAYFLMDRNKKKKNVIEAGLSNGAESTTPTSQPSNLDLPSGMDLPNLTPSTNVPTEVAIQESINVIPTPAVVESKPADTETALNNSLIIPVPKATVPIAEVQEQAPLQAPAQAPVEAPAQAPVEAPSITPVFTPALPSVAPSIAPSVDMVLKAPVFTPALPSVAPSIAPSVDMELKTPYSQYVKEMLAVNETAYNKGYIGNNSNIELQMY